VICGNPSPESFQIGTVLFRPQAKTFEALASGFETLLYEELENLPHGMTQERAREIAQDALKVARRYYKSFPWTAEVKIENFDPTMSRRQAYRIAERAIECTQLLLGASASRHMRLGGMERHPDKRSEIVINHKGIPEVSWSINWAVPPFRDDWWSTLQEKMGPAIIDLIGVALRAGHDLAKPAHLSQRFLDAVSWYGDALRDDFTASSLIKHVTAIERILTTKEEKNKITKTLAERGSALIIEVGFQLENLSQRLGDVYDMRSKLVHGSRSPIKPGLYQSLQDAEQLSRCVLLSFLIFCGQQGLEDRKITEKFLDKSYRRLVERILGRANLPRDES
jgi:hypothetical protein